MSEFDCLSNKTVLVTGGTGSFGEKLVEIILKQARPKVIRLYSRGEHKQLAMQRRFTDDRLRFFIGDVRDKDRLYRAMNGVDLVVHAAALKQVPLAEYNPIEAVKTNIMGAMNVIDAAIDSGVDKVIAISTDKAVQPINLYGATKLVAEKLFVQGNSYAGEKGTKFSCARYGNVVGSDGSILPLLLKQKESKTITITDERMTRFWISLEQGVHFVLNCIDWMRGGEIFVPKLPSMRILDFAETVAPEAAKKIIGIRAGEKIHETLLTEEESRHAREFPTHYVIEPEHPFWTTSGAKNGEPLPESFRYTSLDNQHSLTKQELLQMVKALDIP